MIELHKMHASLVAETGLSFVADFTNSYVTPPFMEVVRELVPKYKHLEMKGAFLRVDNVKFYILKGFALVYNLNFKACESREDALRFVAKEYKA